MLTMEDYVLFLADLCDSSDMTPEKRLETFSFFDAAIQTLNASSLAKDAVLPLSRNYGDEIAAIFSSADQLYRLVVELRRYGELKDTTFRFVAVKGKFGQIGSDITQIGGPVFKLANDLITEAKKQGRFSRWKIHHKLDSALDALSELSNEMIVSMSELQRRVYNRRRTGQTHQEIADGLQKHRQSVTRAIQAGRVDLVIEAEDAINQLLSGE